MLMAPALVSWEAPSISTPLAGKPGDCNPDAPVPVIDRPSTPAYRKELLIDTPLAPRASPNPVMVRLPPVPSIVIAPLLLERLLPLRMTMPAAELAAVLPPVPLAVMLPPPVVTELASISMPMAALPLLPPLPFSWIAPPAVSWLLTSRRPLASPPSTLPAVPVIERSPFGLVTFREPPDTTTPAAPSTVIAPPVTFCRDSRPGVLVPLMLASTLNRALPVPTSMPMPLAMVREPAPASR